MSSIQWFPGHMAKTKKQILQNLKQVDLLAEIIDARAPLSSRNPLLLQLTSSTPRILLMNKTDLADPEVSALWKTFFSAHEKTEVLSVCALTGRGISSVEPACLNLSETLRLRSPGRPVRVMMAGIPNIGKSTLINSLLGKRRTKTGAQPGLTRHLTRIVVSRMFEVFDTPGLLWHKFEEKRTALTLSAIGAIKETILPEEEVAGSLLRFLSRRYPDATAQLYKLDTLPDAPSSLLEAVGRRRGCLLPGGKIDSQRTCQMILKDIREGRFGPVSFERPDDAESESQEFFAPAADNPPPIS